MTASKFYRDSYFGVLKGTEVVICNDPDEWANFFQNIKARQIAVSNIKRDVLVSTVFLGLNHGGINGKPLWFETMVFGGEFGGYQERYETYREAEEGHDKIVAGVRSGILNGERGQNDVANNEMGPVRL